MNDKKIFRYKLLTINIYKTHININTCTKNNNTNIMVTQRKKVFR